VRGGLAVPSCLGFTALLYELGISFGAIPPDICHTDSSEIPLELHFFE
jgi:hypothetical protein